MIAKILKTIANKMEHHNTRKELLKLTPKQLEDIGINPYNISFELLHGKSNV